MDALDSGMYFPVMPQEAPPSGIVPLSGPPNPIGNAEFGGRLRGTAGTGFSQFRIYGMYALVLLLDGGGRYRDRRGMDLRLSPGDLVVVFPEHPHQYGPEPGDDWDEVFIAFKGAAFEGWRAHGLLYRGPRAKTKDAMRLIYPLLWSRPDRKACRAQTIAGVLAEAIVMLRDWAENL